MDRNEESVAKAPRLDERASRDEERQPKVPRVEEPAEEGGYWHKDGSQYDDHSLLNVELWREDSCGACEPTTGLVQTRRKTHCRCRPRRRLAVLVQHGKWDNLYVPSRSGLHCTGHEMRARTEA